ncbi:kelch-like protein 11 [Anneissia japonica]|uniref:kelch-like protein 11 n=1 Tax=Anneissia japonica TaxID=1529436 RepID=UPI0014256B3B|nr:kelch-like protein 11 [Anneissia japonica]XP_033117322.1 kelch-like protein 11 [Anneissia japonica]
MALCRHSDSHKPMEFKENDQAAKVLEKLRQYRNDDKYCDMVLQVEGKEFKAHRNVLAACSPYFDTMCNSGWEEDRRRAAVIEGTTADAMEHILNYMYTGSISLNSDNVHCILEGADHFLMTNLKQHCLHFLDRHLNSSNCLVVKGLSYLYGFEQLLEKSSKFIRNNFKQVVTDSVDDLVRLQFEQILELVSDEKVRVKMEETIYNTILKWVKHDSNSRKQYFAPLLKHVRLAQLNRTFLIKNVEKEELVLASQDCRDLVADAKRQTDTTRTSYCGDSPVLKPRKGKLTDVVVITGGVSDLGPSHYCYVYILHENRWTHLPDLPINELRFHASAVLDGKMYIAGGTSSGLISSRVHCYDTNTNCWYNVESLQTPREYLSLVACNGRLYAMGGIKWDRVLQTVECFDPEMEEWKSATPMTKGRYGMHMAVLDDRYIYAIGGRDEHRRPVPSVERYDTETDTWFQLPSIPLDRDNFWDFPVVEAHKGKIYVTDLSTKELCLNPERNTWTEQSSFHYGKLPERKCFQYCAWNRNVLVFGGSGSERTISSTVPEACIYDRVHGLWSSIRPPPASTLGSSCVILQVPYEFLGD